MPKMMWSWRSAWLVLVVSLAGCQCTGGGVGERCRTNSDCDPGLYCPADTGLCTAAGGTDATGPGTDATGPGTDATGPGTDATGPGTDAAGPGTDATGPGTDATGPGTDASGPGTDAAGPGTDAAEPGCGDGICTAGSGETCVTCSADCGGCCGNGTCDGAAGETCATCAGDCGMCCGNATCEAAMGETCATCAADCGSCCGNTVCDMTAGETCATCVADCGACPPTCGDGICNGGETDCTCPGDCAAACGDGCCTGGETDCTCPGDCGATCGDGCCSGGETDCTCPGDCAAACGDGCCTGGENDCTCAGDCGAACGDGCCTGGETCVSCGADCGICSVCGNGVQESGEECDLGAANATNGDCLPGCLDATCGDGFVATAGPTYFEDCDPPGTGCTATCQIDPDVCASGIGTIACGEAVAGSNTAVGFTDVNTTYSCSAFMYSGNEVAYTFMSAVSTSVTFSLTGLTGDVDLMVLTGAPACATTTCVAASVNGGLASETVTVAVTAGQFYYVLIDGYMGATSTFTLTAVCGSGTCADPYMMSASGPSDVDFGVNLCGDGNDSTSPGVNDCTAGGAGGPDVVFAFDLEYDADVSLDLLDNDGVAIDVVLYVREVCTSATLADTVDCSDDIAGEVRHAHLDLTLMAGTYYLILDSWAYMASGTTFTCGNVLLNVQTF